MRRNVPLGQHAESENLLPSLGERIRIARAGGSIFNQCSSLNPASRRSYSDKASYGRFVLIACVAILVGELVLILGPVMLVDSGMTPKLLALSLFPPAAVIASVFLCCIPRRYDLFEDGTVSVVTVLKRWNFANCRRAFKWLDGGIPGIPFRPTVKFAASNHNCILITRGGERDFYLTISPHDPEAFIDAILMNSARLDSLQLSDMDDQALHAFEVATHNRS